MAGSKNWVGIGLDIAAERIVLQGAEKLSSLDKVADQIKLDQPTFHFFRYVHETRGEQYDEVLFIYACPEGAPIKQRMLFSSSKGSVQELLAEAGGTVYKAFEFTDPADVRDVADIDESLHPAPVEQLKSHTRDRPAKPGKGARRLLSPRSKK